MAPYSYYYLFSIDAVLLMAFFLVNLMLLKASGRTTLGFRLRPDTPEYNRIRRVANSRSIVFAVSLLFLSIGALLDSIRRIVQLNIPDASYSLMLIAAFGIVLFAVLVIIMRHQFKNYFSK